MQKHLAWLIASAVLICGAAGCGSVGSVESHRIKGSETPPPPPTDDADGGEDSLGPCPSGWACMDISAFGMATDGDANEVTASCSNGAQMACDDEDPSASCKGLSDPFCAHLMISGQEIVNCAQRCTL